MRDEPTFWVRVGVVLIALGLSGLLLLTVGCQRDELEPGTPASLGPVPEDPDELWSE